MMKLLIVYKGVTGLSVHTDWNCRRTRLARSASEVTSYPLSIVQLGLELQLWATEMWPKQQRLVVVNHPNRFGLESPNIRMISIRNNHTSCVLSQISDFVHSLTTK